MKLKLKFDKNAIQEFLLENVEKFVFAAVVLAFLGLVAGAIWADRYERTTDELEQSVERAGRDLDDRPTDPDREATDFAHMILDSRPPREEEYRHVASWNPRLVNPLELRGEPPVLLVRELRGSAGYGAFNMRVTRQAGVGRRPAGRGTEQGIRGQRWAVIVGLAPDRQQKQAYEEYFQERIKPSPEPDVPEYIYYRVERAEVDPHRSPSDPEQLEWTPLNLRAALAEAERTWTGTAEEVVDERFVHPRLVFPLGPRVVEERARGYELASYQREMGGQYGGREPASPWGEEVAHPPEIPLRRHRVEDDWDEAPAGQDPIGDPDDPFGDWPMRGDDGRGRPRPRPGTPRTRPPRMMGEEGMFQHGRGEYGGEETDLYDRDPDYLLFRFFDYSVEPGKSYRYRVRLLLANPNFGLDPKFLERPELARQRWIEKDRWSEPSPVITIPRDTFVLAGGVHPLLRDTDEPRGTVAIIKWRKETGEEVHRDFPVMRGQLLDYPETVIREPRQRRREDDGGTGVLIGRGPRKEPEIEEPDKVDFVTGMVALDLIGGRRLPSGSRTAMTEPGRVLVMDHDGTLRMLSEVEDQIEYERRTVEPEPEPDDMPDMMYDEEGMMMMDEMMPFEGERPPRGRRPQGRTGPR